MWLDEVETQPSLVLSLLALATLSHLAASVLLYLGVRLARREFLLPWLVTHMVIVIIMTTIFTVWTFITFFIDLLVSVVFPVLSGLVLGLSILAWRLVLAAYRNHLVRSVKSALYTLSFLLLRQMLLGESFIFLLWDLVVRQNMLSTFGSYKNIIFCKNY